MSGKQRMYNELSRWGKRRRVRAELAATCSDPDTQELHSDDDSGGTTLPKDARTLLKCKSNFDLKTIDGGQFCYVGVASGILLKQNELILDEGVDD